MRPLVKPNQVHKMTAIFIQNSPELPFRLKMAVFLSKNSYHFVHDVTRVVTVAAKTAPSLYHLDAIYKCGR